LCSLQHFYEFLIFRCLFSDVYDSISRSCCFLQFLMSFDGGTICFPVICDFTCKVGIYCFNIVPIGGAGIFSQSHCASGTISPMTCFKPTSAAATVTTKGGFRVRVTQIPSIVKQSMRQWFIAARFVLVDNVPCNLFRHRRENLKDINFRVSCNGKG
jgi:hypothetical protein